MSQCPAVGALLASTADVADASRRVYNSQGPPPHKDWLKRRRWSTMTSQWLLDIGRREEEEEEEEVEGERWRGRE